MGEPEKPVSFTLTQLERLYRRKEKIVMLTCYDATFAAVAEAAGVEMLLVGDSLGMVIQGHETTLPVSVDDVAYHVRAVAKGARRALIVADMPFGSYQASAEDAFRCAARFLGAGAQMVKLEGGRSMHETVRFLVDRGVPVCGHIGLTPQAVHRLGGYRVQGREQDAADRLREEARLLEQAGASVIVLELVPAALAREITDGVKIPTIGIGAGVDCSGQVLVLYDMLGIYTRRKPRFVRDFMVGSPSIAQAIASYVHDVKASQFPAAEHSF